MNKDSAFFSYAESVNNLSYALFYIGAFFSVLVMGLLVFFCIKYRIKHEGQRGDGPKGHIGLEIFWSVVPFIILVFIFVWGAKLFMDFYTERSPDYRVTVLGKQWMWKSFHSNGKREIDSLHVPLGKVTEITLISQDVIHSFFIPKLRFKQDVMPGKYVKIFVHPTQEGRFPILCAEYCGTDHSRMRGELVVHSPESHTNWLNRPEDAPIELLQASGRRLFQKMDCASCHQSNTNAIAPVLKGLWQAQRELDDGRNIKVDENYLRQSILNPNADIHKGYPAIMPTYKGQVSEEEIISLVEYLKTL